MTVVVALAITSVFATSLTVYTPLLIWAFCKFLQLNHRSSLRAYHANIKESQGKMCSVNKESVMECCETGEMGDRI